MPQYTAKVDFPIWPNDRQQGNQPNYRGHFEISTALLKEMVEAKKRGEQPILQVACWDNKSKNGNKYLGCILSMDQYRMDKAAGDTAPAKTENESEDAEEEEEEGLFD